MKKKDIFLYIFSFIIPFAADRVSKYLVLHYLVAPYEIAPFFFLDFCINRGISWGLLHSENSLFFHFITVLVGAVIVGLVWHTIHRIRECKVVFGEFLVLSGALSNMIDRYYYQGVVDFILITWRGWMFPTFNIADVAIVIGVVVMMFTAAREP